MVTTHNDFQWQWRSGDMVHSQIWKFLKSVTFLFLSLVVLCPRVSAVPGDVEDSFNSPYLGYVYSTAMQANGKILIGGSSLTQLNTDGSLDADFNQNANATISSIVVQDDLKIVIGGGFSTVGGVTRNRIARLNADGSLDAGFNPDVSGAPNSSGAIVCMALQPDGKVLIGGFFTSVGGVARNRIARLNADGSLDTGFDVNPNGEIRSITVQTEGKILIGGGFTALGEVACTGIARLNVDGSLDMSFNPSVNGGTSCIAVQADGKILWCGYITVGGVSDNRIVRLNVDGSLDTGYNPNVSGPIGAMVLQADGKLVIAGRFASVGGVARNYIARINADGSLDPGFNPNANNTVESMAVQANGKIVIGGTFTTVGGVIRYNIARLDNYPATQSLTIPSSSRVQWLLGGSSPETSEVVFELSTDAGANWTLLGRGTRILGGWEKPGLSLPSSGLVRVRGRTIDGGGSSGLIEAIAPFPPNVPPVVENPAADINVNEDAPDSVIDVRAIFQDQETPDADLTYSITSSIPLSLLSAAINPISDQLTFSFHPNQFGVARITVRATDSVGLYVEDSFLLTVNRQHDGDPGDLNLGFDPNANGEVLSMAMQANGKIIVGGAFTSFSGVLRNRIARINADGGLDSGFYADVIGDVQSIVAQTDGKIVIAGRFGSVGGVTRNRIARLNSDGSLDTGYNPNANGDVRSMSVQADGKLVIGGDFTSIGGVTRNRIARLNADGSLDTSFSVVINNAVYSTAVQANGEIVIGGAFTSVGGVLRNRIARLNTNGIVDTGFAPNINTNVLCTTVQPDGKIVIGGYFTSIGSTTRNYIARLNVDGSLDTNFNPNATGSVSCIAFQTDGKMLIGGLLPIVRLNADGSRDLSFNPNPDGVILSIVLQSDGKVVIGGSFTSIGGVGRNRIAQLVNNPATQNLTVPSVNRIQWGRGGTAPETSEVTFDLSTNAGANWTSMGSGTRIAAGWEKTGLSLPGSGLIRARARTISGQYNGSGGLMEEIAAFPPNAQPVVSNPTPDVIVNEDWTGAIIDMRAVFSDAETADADMVYSITSNGTPSLVTASVNNTSDQLILARQPYQFGRASITVRATDSVGLYVEESFLVTVSVVHDGDAGDLNMGFDPNANSHVFSTAVHFDGRILIGGSFTKIGDATRNRIARLNADGSLDTNFNPNASDAVRSIVIQADGKIVIGGVFSTIGSSTRNYLARLNANGGLDSTFNPIVNGDVSSVAVQADGKIVFSGNFTNVSGETRNRIARLNVDGSLDIEFNPNANAIIYSVTVQPDGKLVLGGDFTSVGDVARNRIARLRSDGGLETEFNPTANARILSTAVQADGKLLIGGDFTSVGGVTRNRIARLNADGSLDTNFDPNANSGVTSTSVQTDGKIVIGGYFNNLGGVVRNRIARINADGSLDTPFNPNADESVFSTIIQANGKIVIGGFFTRVGDATRNRIAQLDNDPATQSLTVPSVNRIQWLRGGASPETIDVVFERSSDDGANWTALGAGARIDSGWEKTGLTLSGAGIIRARARTTGGYYSGSSGIVETQTAFNFLSAIHNWRQTHFGNPANSGDGADVNDFDKDGTPNFLEFFHNLNPKLANTALDLAALPTVGVEYGGGAPQYLTLTWRQNAQASNQAVEVQVSGDLSSGSWQTVTPDVTENLALDPVTGDPRIRVKVAIPSGTNAKFVRLRVNGLAD